MNHSSSESQKSEGDTSSSIGSSALSSSRVVAPIPESIILKEPALEDDNDFQYETFA